MAIHVHIEPQELEAEPGISLFECADRLDLPIISTCGKQGTCRECLVEVTEGAELLSRPTAEEQHLRGRFRLACRARLQADRGKVRFHRMRWTGLQVLDAGTEGSLSQRGVPAGPAVTRDGQTVLIDGEPITRVPGPLHGLAIDIGTTTVVVRLVDLESGASKASQSFENPQRFAGSDVMTRIAYDATDPDRRLQQTLAAYLNHAIAALPCSPETIYEVAVAGNPTMRDLLFGLDVRSLGQSPYRSVSELELNSGRRDDTSLSAPAREIGLHTHSQARVYGLPLIGGHVGADAAASLLAIDALNEQRLVALMDIGTNTEILIGNHHRMLAASCPAGPAFEGGTITCGMPAFAGAVDAVELDGTPRYRVIGGGTPQGICGSGLVSLLSELLRTSEIDRLGRLRTDRFLLDDRAEIYLSDADISRLAQAKAAQTAGWTLAARHYGADFTDLQQLYLAGGFGDRVDPKAALRIGLLPQIPLDKISPVGNSAIEGATLALRSRTLRHQLEMFVRNIEHVELETDDGFFDAFVEGCQFKPLGAT